MKLLTPLYVLIILAGVWSWDYTLVQAATPVFTSSQEGTSAAKGYVLQTNGTNSTWVATSTLGLGGSGGGTVTSVALTVPSGLSVSGSPITSSGTFAVTLASGYNIPLTASTTNWNAAYNNEITTLTTSGTSGAATLSGGTLNIPNYANTTYTAGTGLTLSAGAFSVNTSQNIAKLSNLTGNGLVKTSGGTGTLSIATGDTDFQNPISLTTTGSSGPATFSGDTLNVPQYAGTTYTASYPVTLTGSAFGLAFGTTSSNTWGGTQTFTNAIVDSSLSGLIAGNSGTTYAAATSTLTASSPLTGSFTYIGTGGSLGCQTASASQAGCLSATDWSTFSSKLSNAITSIGPNGQLQTGNTGIVQLATSTLSFNGLTLGTKIVGSGNTITWTPTVTGTLSNSGLANSTISGVALGGTLAALSATNGTLTFSGSYTGTAAQTIGLNLGNANTFTALQQFNGNASTTQITSSGNAYLLGNTGLGTTSPTKLLYVEGNQSGGVARIQRDFPSTPTNSVVGTYDVLLNETGAGSLADQTGPGQTFGVSLAGGAEAIMADMSGYRDGADTSGGFLIRTYNVGSPVIAFNISHLGNIGISSSTPFNMLSIGSKGSSLFGSIAVTENKLATTTSMTIDWTKGNQQLVQIGTSATTIAFSNVTAGAHLIVNVCNPGGTAGALTWTGVEWSGGTAPTQTTTANVCDIWSFDATQATSTSVSAFKVFGAMNANYP